MLIRGTPEHYSDIHRMAVSFFEASPYKDQGIDHSRVMELIDLFLSADPYDKICILAVEDEVPVGVLAATAETNLFNRNRFACEIIWWIDPPFRKAGVAEKMRKAYDYWAKNVDCQSSALVDVMGNLDNYYTRKGYGRCETTYLKVF